MIQVSKGRHSKPKDVKIEIQFEEDLQHVERVFRKFVDGERNDKSCARLLLEFMDYFSYLHYQTEKTILKPRSGTIEPNDTGDNLSVAVLIQDPFNTTHYPGVTLKLDTDELKNV